MNRVKKEERVNPDLFKVKPLEGDNGDYSFEDYVPKPNPNEPLKHKHLPELPKQKDS